MKKAILIGLAVALVLGLGGLVWQGVQSDATNIIYDKTFTLPAQNLKEIYLAGLEQPVEVKVTETEQAETSVTIKGKFAQSNLDAMEEQFGIDEMGDLTIDFAKDGFSMTVNTEKPTVTIAVALAKGVSFEDFYLHTTNGGAVISLPASYDGQFTAKSTEGKTDLPENGGNSNRVAKIEAVKDVTVSLD